MKQTRLLKTLLVALCLLTGTTSLWAETVWKTYKTWDFVTGYAAADVSGLLPSGSWTTSGSGTSTVAKVSTTIASATAVTTSTSNRYYGIKLHADKDKMQLASDGIGLLGAASYVTIPNLKTGQRVTVTIDNANGVEVYSSSVATLTGVTTSQSGSYYNTVGIVGTGGDLTIKRYGGTTFRIRSILVETPVVYETPALYSQDFESYTAGEDTPTSAGWTLTGGVGSIEEASSNKYAKFVPNTTKGNRGQSYNFASASVTTASNYWKIEFDAALTSGSDRTATSVAITSSKSGNITTNEAASGDLYFLCVQKANNSQEYNIYLGNSTETAVQTCTLTNGTFYHFTITYDGTTISAKIGSNSTVTKAVSSSTVGTLKGLKTCESRNQGIVCIDNIILHNFLPPSFTMSEDSKDINEGSNTTVDVTSVVGDISVSSSDETKATASYADGTLTINGVAKGTATITVSCYKNGVTISKAIDVTVKGYDDLYAEEKAPYDTKVESLDAAGQAYWAANVTPAASVTDEASYNTAVAALPTTYVAAVKAQTAGSNMTDAVENANCENLTDWGTVTAWSSTSDQFHGNSHSTDVAQISTPFAESWVYTGGDASAAVLEDQTISHTAITGLKAGIYRVTGFIRAASEGSHASETPTGFSLYANNETSSTTEGISSAAGLVYGTYSVDVTLDGTEDLVFGINVKDANFNWVAFKDFTLTYLGAEKKTYTINAVAGETVIKELASGSEWPSDAYGVYVPKVIKYSDKYYVLDEDNVDVDGYYANYVMGSSDVTNEVSYTLDESIVYFEEGESNTQATTYGNFSNGACSTYRKADKYNSVEIAQTGVYCAEIYIGDGHASNSRNFAINTKSEDTYTPIFTITGTIGATRGLHKKNLDISAGTTLYTGYSANTLGVDYIIIRKLPSYIPVEITSVGAATFVSNYALDFSNVAGLEAYIATAQNGANITFDKVGAVPAGTPLYLRGATADVPVVASAEAVDNNLLVAGTGAAVASEADGKFNFILNKVDDVLGFYWAADNTVATNRAYLSLSDNPFNGGAKGVNMIFNGETTGIYSVGAQSKEANVKGIYNLQGQRVYNPTKGLYIIDGKKYVIN